MSVTFSSSRQIIILHLVQPLPRSTSPSPSCSSSTGKSGEKRRRDNVICLNSKRARRTLVVALIQGVTINLFFSFAFFPISPISFTFSQNYIPNMCEHKKICVHPFVCVSACVCMCVCTIYSECPCVGAHISISISQPVLLLNWNKNTNTLCLHLTHLLLLTREHTVSVRMSIGTRNEWK